MDVDALRHGALIMLLLASGGSFAQTATIADLDRIQADTLKLKAEAYRAKAAAELASYRSADLATADNSGGLPVAKGVFGGNGKRYVAFVYPNGGTAEAAAGGSIPGGYIVKSFDTAGVVLTKGGRVQRIPFSMHAPTPALPAATQGAQAFGVPTTGPVTPVPPLR